jgi:LysM repeat protein/predicted esterase
MRRRSLLSALLVLSLLAAPAAAASAAPSPAASEIEVRAGDTLGGIARRHGTTVRALAAANGIRPDGTIRTGQKLRLPGGEPSQRMHVVVSGDSLVRVARHYGVAVKDLVAANGLRSENHIQIGQRLVIPGSKGGASAPAPEPEPADRGMQVLQVPGAPPAYYFEPEGPGRLGLRPVLMYLHGRGAQPAGYCQRWAKVVRRFGWLVCPQGPEDRGEGKRGWGGSWAAGRRTAMAALEALRARYGRRVQLYGNTIMGFSEGAFMAMNVGLMEPRAFNRWLILGADTDYWGPHQLQALERNRGRIRRVYLITGQQDLVHDEIPKVKQWLTRAGVPVRVSTPKDLGHTVALETKPSMYKAALTWLSEG